MDEARGVGMYLDRNRSRSVFFAYLRMGKKVKGLCRYSTGEFFFWASGENNQVTTPATCARGREAVSDFN